MFKRAMIHYPPDENALQQIIKDIAAFRCAAVVKYIETLQLSDRQIETLFDCLTEEIAKKNHSTPEG